MEKQHFLKTKKPAQLTLKSQEDEAKKQEICKNILNFISKKEIKKTEKIPEKGHMEFGKYRAQPYTDVFKDREYCNFLVFNCPNAEVSKQIIELKLFDRPNSESIW